MTTTGLSKYTLGEIDNIFITHPILSRLNYTERVTAYNEAQNRIAGLLDNIYQITNFTITDNQLVFLDDKERNTVNGLTDDNLIDLRLGTTSIWGLSASAYLDEFTDSQKLMIFNMAQDVLARLKNDYDTLGYYQLWYNTDGPTYVATQSSIPFYTSYTASIGAGNSHTYNGITVYDNPGNRAVIGELGEKSSFKSSFTYKLYIPGSFSYKDSANFYSSFIALVASTITATQNNNTLEFKTSFTTSIVTPVTKTETDEFGFYTTFTSAIV